MTKKGIIYETLGSTAQMRVVESSSNGEMLLHGIFGVCGIKNGNNRIYEKANYSKMVGALQETMKSEAVLGELEHPATMNITLENVSHKIEEITMNEDGTVTGTIRLLDTPKGKIARAIIEGGCPLYISSRGAGSIDESGHVTLTTLKTYDLVGTPGFSQAKLTLKQGQKFEALNESLENPAWMIVESEEVTDTPDKNDGITADDNITMEDIKKSIDELTQKVEKLESELHIAKEAKYTAEKALSESLCKPKVNYDGIQAWIEEEYAPELRQEICEAVKGNILGWVNESYSPVLQKWVMEEFSGKVTEWIAEEFGNKATSWASAELAPAIEKWVAEEYSDTLQKWIAEEYSGTLQKWITEEFAPVVEKWVTEEFAAEQNKNISEFLESQRDNGRFEAIDNVLEKLSQSVDSAAAAQEILEAQQKDKYAGVPVVEGMPMNYRPLWEALSDEKKGQIIRESRMYNMNQPNAVEKFWSTRQLTADTVTESRQTAPVAGTPMNESRANMFAAMSKLRRA